MFNIKNVASFYIDAEHFRNNSAIKHFKVYLVGSVVHPDGDLKEIEHKYKLKVK